MKLGMTRTEYETFVKLRPEVEDASVRRERGQVLPFVFGVLLVVGVVFGPVLLSWLATPDSPHVLQNTTQPDPHSKTMDDEMEIVLNWLPTIIPFVVIGMVAAIAIGIWWSSLRGMQ